MVTVYTQKQLKEAIKENKSPIVPGNRKMALTLCVAVSLFALRTKGAKRPSVKEIVAYMRGEGIGGQDVAAISEGTLVILVGIAAVTAITIVALCLGRDLVIEYDPETGQFKLKAKNGKGRK